MKKGVEGFDLNFDTLYPPSFGGLKQLGLKNMIIVTKRVDAFNGLLTFHRWSWGGIIAEKFKRSNTLFSLLLPLMLPLPAPPLQ
jgi:hypothetical protein